jgi:hypothetical protein
VQIKLNVTTWLDTSVWTQEEIQEQTYTVMANELSVWMTCKMYSAMRDCCVFSVGTCPLSGPKRSREEEEAHARRAAEREGRRTRRRRAREMRSGNTVRHVDGMSSDDEMTELEATAFRNQKGKVGRMFHCFLLQVTAVAWVA